MWIRFAAALSLGALCACQQDPSPAAAADSAGKNAGAPSNEVVNPMAVAKAKLRVGTSIELCWRRQPAGNRFADNPKPFQCPGSIQAIKAPMSDSEGGVNGKLVFEAMRGFVPDLEPGKLWARGVESGKDPRELIGAIDIKGESSSWFGNYVGVDEHGKARMYLEVDAK